MFAQWLVPLVAQAGAVSAIGTYAIIGIIIAAIVAVVYVILNRMGIQIPSWVVTLFWIIVAAVVGILVVRFLMSLAF
jgi:hypothetical protein